MVENRKGVTLTELLIVISIIAFLATIALVSFRGQIFKATDAKKKSEIKKIQLAVEEYEKDNDCYPTEWPVEPDYSYQPEPGTCPSWYRIHTKLNDESDFWQGSPNAPNP